MTLMTERIKALEWRVHCAKSDLAIRNVIVRYGMAADCGDAKTAAN